MDTHQDRDFPLIDQYTDDQRKNLAAVSQKAADMTAKLESVITAGLPGEPVLLEATVNGILMRRLPDDPLEAAKAMRFVPEEYSVSLDRVEPHVLPFRSAR